MRIYLYLTPNNDLVPYNYQEKLVGRFHSWMGENLIHDSISLYSMSWLYGGKGHKNGLTFKNGACWFISSPHTTLLKKLITQIKIEPNIAFGMRVKEIVIKETPYFQTKAYFHAVSPILIKRTTQKGKIQFYSYDDEKANDLLTETLRHKLKEFGINNNNVRARFDSSYPNAKTKLVTYKGVQNKANFCPVIIEGDGELISFAWDVGLGNSTGIGFGAIEIGG